MGTSARSSQINQGGKLKLAAAGWHAVTHAYSRSGCPPLSGPFFINDQPLEQGFSLFFLSAPVPTYGIDSQKCFFIFLIYCSNVQVWANGDVTINTGTKGRTLEAKIILNLALGVFKVEVGRFVISSVRGRRGSEGGGIGYVSMAYEHTCWKSSAPVFCAMYVLCRLLMLVPKTKKVHAESTLISFT